MKDNFSAQADLYAQYRPSYPDALFRQLFTLVKEKHCAWDCATGNGQMAVRLAEQFNRVFATDISANQLANAITKDNIHYSIQAAESSNFPDRTFDLITVAQAVHWFNFDAFYKEVNRTLKDDGLLVLTGYGGIKTDAETDVIIAEFYTQIVGPYWDKERHYIDEQYQTIPFPFNEIKLPPLYISYRWHLDHLLGYLNTWSSVQHYIRQKGSNPVELIKPQLEALWHNNVVKEIRFPVLMRAGHKLIL